MSIHNLHTTKLQFKFNHSESFGIPQGSKKEFTNSTLLQTEIQKLNNPEFNIKSLRGIHQEEFKAMDNTSEDTEFNSGANPFVLEQCKKYLLPEYINKSIPIVDGVYKPDGMKNKLESFFKNTIISEFEESNGRKLSPSHVIYLKNLLQRVFSSYCNGKLDHTKVTEHFDPRFPNNKLNNNSKAVYEDFVDWYKG